jgi:signal transduction histidine kinase
VIHLEDSLEAVGAVVLPRRRTVQRNFRRRLVNGGFSKEECEALLDVTPAAAALSWETVKLGARRLALMKIDHDRILRALAEYELAADPIYASCGPDTDLSRKHVQCALLLAMNESVVAIQEQEQRALGHLLEAESAARDAHSLFELAADCLRADFQAVMCAVGRPLKRGVGTRGVSAFALTPRKADWLVDQSWKDREGFVWSAPAGGALLQLGFSAARRMYTREAELLGVLGQRLGSALHCFEREERQRAVSLQMLDVEELERLRISRELHDDAAQALALIRLQLEMIETGPANWEAVREALAETRGVTERTILSVRRLLSDLSPAVLQQLGLAAAARQLARRLRTDAGVHVRVQLGTLPQLPQRVSLAVYRILQEALVNVARHAQANNVMLSISSSATHIRLSVEDDGVGFDPGEVANRARCYGLMGIRLRVVLLGGVVSVRSREEGNPTTRVKLRGTQLSVQIPLTGEYPTGFKL